jgi:hypothetical protein
MRTILALSAGVGGTSGVYLLLEWTHKAMGVSGLWLALSEVNHGFMSFLTNAICETS